MDRFRRWWPLLLLALAPVWPLWRAIFLGHGIGPWDHIRAMAPWNGPAATQPWDVLQADGVLQFAPWRYMVLDAWSKGQMPFWNPHQLMGTPLLANSQSAGFYPPHILLGVLHVPVYPAMTFLAWLHLFWAGLGVYVLCRRLGAARMGALIGGVSFALSPFMLAWTPLPSVITTVAWIPWCLAAVLARFGTPLFRVMRADQADAQSLGRHASAEREDRRANARSSRSLALSTGMMILAGHLQFVAYGLMAIAVSILVLLVLNWKLRFEGPVKVKARKIGSGDDAATGSWTALDQAPLSVRLAMSSGLRATLACTGAILVGFCLAAPQLLPVLAYSKQSHRQSVAGESGYQSYLGGAVSPFQLTGLVYPTVLGHPAQAADLIPGANTYWPALAKPGADFAESAIGIGPVVFAVLFLLRRRDWKDPGVAALASVGVLGLLIALGTPFNRLLYFWVPGWSATGSPGRAGFLFVLATCALAGVGATRALEGVDAAARKRMGIPLTVGALTILAAFLMRDSLPDPYHLAGALGVLSMSALAGAMLWIVAALVATVFFLFGKGRIARGIAALAAPILILNGTTPILSGAPIEPSTAASTERIAAVNRSWELVTPRPALLPPNTASLMGLCDVGGYDSLLDKDTKALLDGANGRDSAPPTNGNMMFVKTSADWARLRELGVSQVWSTVPLPGMPSNVAPESGVFRYVLGGPGRASSYSMPASVTEDGYDHTTVRVYGGAPLVLRDRNMPGWTATVDGNPAVIEAAGPFRRVRLQRGDHTVVFHYWPPGLTAGLRLFALGCAALVLLALFAWKAKRIG